MTGEKGKKINCSNKYKFTYLLNYEYSLKSNYSHVSNPGTGKFDFNIVNLYSSKNALSEKRPAQIFYSSCFAVRLARLLIGIVKNNSYKTGKGCSFNNDFYKKCSLAVHSCELREEVDDEELIAIYIKQTMQLLRVSELVFARKGTAMVSEPDVSDERLFIKLFLSFWNEVNWEDIFPSDPDAAVDLKENRSFIRDILLRHSSRVKLSDIANNFFNMTGFAALNDIMQISFLDFYLFTWLKHFGLIRYIENSRSNPVYVELTEFGRIFLSNLY